MVDKDRICVVGAGAVGLLYARFLRRAGADVSLLVKPSQIATCERGFALHQLRFGRRRVLSERLDGLRLYESAGDVASEGFDQIWLTVASDALRAPWLAELLGGTSDSTIVILQPDLDDRGLVLRHVSDERLVHGLIGFLSFQSPLAFQKPGISPLPQGIVYTLLPGTASSFDGCRASHIVATLRRAGFAARQTTDLAGISAERSATTVPLMAGLEAARWSLDRLLASPWLSQSASASREALAAVAFHLNRPPAAARHILHPPILRSVLRAAPRLTPFDLEAYLRFHFSKVGPQTRLMLETYSGHARTAGLSTVALDRLRAAL